MFFLLCLVGERAQVVPATSRSCHSRSCRAGEAESTAPAPAYNDPRVHLPRAVPGNRSRMTAESNLCLSSVETTRTAPKLTFQGTETFTTRVLGFDTTLTRQSESKETCPKTQRGRPKPRRHIAAEELLHTRRASQQVQILYVQRRESTLQLYTRRLTPRQRLTSQPQPRPRRSPPHPRHPSAPT